MIKAYRLIRKTPTLIEMDSVKVRQKSSKNNELRLLEDCRNLWNNLTLFREQRARAFRYTYVDQLSDLVEVDGKLMTQRDYLRAKGQAALQTNQMKNKVETLEGVIVKEALKPICHSRDRDEQQYGEVMTNALQANCDKNKISKLYTAWVKEAALGGLMVGYESWDSTTGVNGQMDTWTQYINPNMVFFDATLDDPRFWDLSIIGRIKKYDFGKLCANFARSEKDFAILSEIYHQQSNLYTVRNNNDDLTERFDDTVTDFMTDPNPTICCVCEVWTKETKPRIRLHDTNAGSEEIIDADDHAYRRQVRDENRRRKALGLQAGMTLEEIPFIEGDGFGEEGFFMDEFWYCRDLAPDGTVLWEGESPYAERQHPFSIAALPMVDGRIVGYLYDMIDHNIIMNQAICLNNWLLQTGAKGVVFMPKDLVPKDIGLEKFANSWMNIDDLVYIDLKPGMENMMPKVFKGNAQSFDVAKYLDLFSRMADKSTAITDALQGKTPFSGASGALYAQMATNSTTAIASFLETIHLFFEDVHTKKLKNIASFYDERRFHAIAGSIETIADYDKMDLNKVGDIEYDLAVKEGTDTGVYRAAVAQDAKEFLMNGIIDFETYLEIADVPYADKLLQKVQAQKAAVDQGQVDQQQQIPATA